MIDASFLLDIDYFGIAVSFIRDLIISLPYTAMLFAGFKIYSISKKVEEIEQTQNMIGNKISELRSNLIQIESNTSKVIYTVEMIDGMISSMSRGRWE